MSDLRAIADRVEIEALRGEFADAVMRNLVQSTQRVYGVRYLDVMPQARSVPQNTASP